MAGLFSKVRAYITPERKQKAVSVTKQMGRGAGVMGRGLASGFQRLGANIQASGMFSEVEQPERSEYLPGTRKSKRRARKPKSRLQELQDAGLI